MNFQIPCRTYVNASNTSSHYDFTSLITLLEIVRLIEESSLHNKLLDQNFKSKIKLSMIQIRQFEKRDENH